jgi:hypothetical protein
VSEKPDSLSRDYVRVCSLIARKLVLHPPDLEFPGELQRAIWQIQFTLEQDAVDWATPPEKTEHEMYINMLNVSTPPRRGPLVKSSDVLKYDK